MTTAEIDPRSTEHAVYAPQSPLHTMPVQPESLPHPLDDHTRPFSDVQALLRGNVPPDRFWDQFLKEAQLLAGVRGSLLWLLNDTKQQLVVRSAQRVRELGLLDDRQFMEASTRVVLQTVASGESTFLAGDEQQQFPPQFAILIEPIAAGRRPVGAVQFLIDSGLPKDALRQLVDGLRHLCRLGGEYCVRQIAPQSETAPPIQMERSLLELHRRIDLKRTALTTVNDGRLLLGSDRVSLVVRRGRAVRVLAVSGLEQVNRRADDVQSLQRLGAAALRTGQTVWVTGDVDELPLRLEEPIAQHLQLTGVRMVGLLPLYAPLDPTRDAGDGQPRPDQRKPQRPIGCLILESHSDSNPTPIVQQRSQVWAEHVSVAVANALELKRIPLLGLWRLVGAIREGLYGRALTKTALAFAVAVAIVAALVFTPWGYTVEANGRLMPATQLRVFAPWDGDVVQVFVEDGQRIIAGTPLVQLRNEELSARVLATRSERQEKTELERALRGELAAAARGSDRQEELRVRGQLKETQVQLATLTQQSAILEQREQNLLVRAPIEGVVATFQVEQLLSGRPVVRGELLLEVMAEAGPWRLEVQIPEHRMGHLRGALDRDPAAGLPVTFYLETQAERSYTGRLTPEAISTRSDVDEEQGAIVEALVSFDTEELPDRRIGAEARAKIECGQRSLSYVLFGDVWEFLLRHLWL